MNPVVFILPGLYSSGPQHWQTHWEKEYGFIRINQQDWETPVCEDWIRTIDAAVTQHPAEQVILVGQPGTVAGRVGAPETIILITNAAVWKPASFTTIFSNADTTQGRKSQEPVLCRAGQ